MIAILGAGISGLSLAYYLRKAGKQVLVFEKSATPGGKIQSIQQDGFTMEAGPNTVLLNNQEIVNLIPDLGLQGKLIFPDPASISKRFVLFDGKPTAIPTGPVSSISSPMLSFSTLGKIFADLRMSKLQPEKESLASLVKRHFGDEVFENFIVPMLTGIYAGDPEKMDADFVLPFLKKASRAHGSIIKGMMRRKKEDSSNTALPKQKIFTFAEGLQTLPRVLSLEIGESLKLECEVEEITKNEKGYNIRFRNNGKEETANIDQVISTLPASALAKIQSNFLKEVVTSLEKVPYVPAVVIHLAYESSSMGFGKKAFGLLSRPAENVPFLGVLFNSRFFPHTAPAGKELLTVICGGGFNSEIAQWDESRILNEVQGSLEKILAIKAQPDFYRIKRWENAIPQYYLGHQEILDSFKKFEQVFHDFHLAGNYINGISVSDCIKNSKKLAEKIVNR